MIGVPILKYAHTIVWLSEKCRKETDVLAMYNISMLKSIRQNSEAKLTRIL